MERLGRYTLKLSGTTGVIGYAAVGGKTEGEGPLAGGFDYIYPDDGMGQSTWEQAESAMLNNALTRAIKKAGKKMKIVLCFSRESFWISAQALPSARKT